MEHSESLRGGTLYERTFDSGAIAWDYIQAMHPPEFKYQNRLSDWPKCSLEVRCDRCNGRMVQYPVTLLIDRRGDITFAELMYRLRCKGCDGQPTSIFLCASSSRSAGFGLSPDWSLELRPSPAPPATPERRAKRPAGKKDPEEREKVVKLSRVKN